MYVINYFPFDFDYYFPFGYKYFPFGYDYFPFGYDYYFPFGYKYFPFDYDYFSRLASCLDLNKTLKIICDYADTIPDLKYEFNDDDD